MTDAFDQWRSQVINTAERLDEIDYFRLLGCGADAKPAAIRQAFRQLASSYHPDGFAGSDDEALQGALSRIYRRLTEAYAVLRNPSDRAAYQAGLNQGQTRFDPDRSARAKRHAQAAAKPGQTERGRRHYESATLAIAQSDRYTARAEIRMALLHEPTEPAFLALAKELQGG
jgi:DnaJ-class molecular chaperone